MAALRLVDKGLFGLDEDVNARLTSWKVPENDLTKAEKVTLEQPRPSEAKQFDRQPRPGLSWPWTLGTSGREVTCGDTW